MCRRVNELILKEQLKRIIRSKAVATFKALVGFLAIVLCWRICACGAMEQGCNISARYRVTSIGSNHLCREYLPLCIPKSMAMSTLEMLTGAWIFATAVREPPPGRLTPGAKT
jgi:hypothetical protein